MTPLEDRHDHHEAFAAAMARLVPTRPKANHRRALNPDSDYKQERLDFIERCRKGDYGAGRRQTAQGIIDGYYGVDLDQYVTVHVMIYGPDDRWSEDPLTPGGNDED